jgi:hypothetical protein
VEFLGAPVSYSGVAPSMKLVRDVFIFLGVVDNLPQRNPSTVKLPEKVDGSGEGRVLACARGLCCAALSPLQGD